MAQHSIFAQWLHVLSGPVQHGLHQAEGVLGGELEEGLGQRLEVVVVVEELNSEVRIRSGLDHSSATVKSKEGEQFQPCGAPLLGVVDDGQHPDTVPENAHHNQGHSLRILQRNGDSIDEG